MAKTAKTTQTEPTSSVGLGRFVVLTNANQQFRGQPIAIRLDQIITVYPNNEIRDAETGQPNTFVFCPPHGTWEVTENFEEVLNLVNP